MFESEMLTNLENIVAQLGIHLRYEKGDFHGGVCRIDDKQMLIINRSLQSQQKIMLIAEELAKIDLSGVFIIPAVRKLIETSTGKHSYQEA